MSEAGFDPEALGLRILSLYFVGVIWILLVKAVLCHIDLFESS